MLHVRDEKRLPIGNSHNNDVCRVEAPRMDRPFFDGNNTLDIQTSKSFECDHFISTGLPGSFQDVCFSIPTSEEDLVWPTKSFCDQIVSESDDEAPPRFMSFEGLVSPWDSPATRALDRLCKVEHSKRTGAPAAGLVPKRRTHRTSLKRNRPCSLVTVDASDMIEATHVVEDSITFPVIAWKFEEGDGGDVKNEEASLNCPSAFRDVGDVDQTGETSRAKRICRGLVRSIEIACDLFQMLDSQ